MIESFIDARDFDADASRVDIELFGDGHGQAGMNALTHLGFSDDNGHDIVAINAYKRMGLEGCCANCAFCGPSVDEPTAIQSTGNDSASNDGDADQKMPTAGVSIGHVVHDFAPLRNNSAAR